MYHGTRESETGNESDKEQTNVQLRVDMGDVTITEPNNSLITTVGSCVAVCIYDSYKKVGGMVHIVHPKRSMLVKSNNPSKFADTAVPILVSKLAESGAKKVNLKAKISGGANMFPTIQQDVMQIGKDNVEAVKLSLKDQRIPLIAEDVGGEMGRRIEFLVGPNKLVIRKLSGENKII